MRDLNKVFILYLGLVVMIIMGVMAWQFPKPAATEPRTTRTSRPPSTSPSTLPLDTEEQPKRNLPRPSEDAIPDEYLLSFPSEQALEEFMISSNGIEILGRSLYSNTLRVRAHSSLSDLLPEGAQIEHNYYVSPPPLVEGTLSPSAVGFEGRVLEWLGITEDNRHWGEGVSVAVIDTGLMDHPVFDSDVTAYSLIESTSELHPHGTAMASLWRVETAIAPAVDLMSIQVSDSTGFSDLFTLAEAIYLAVDQGADLIPISMASVDTNSTLDDAIQYAVDHGALIIASAGNSGTDTPMYPAAHPDVISVTALDYYRNYPGFANTGESLTLAAPGVGLVTAHEEDGYSLSTGTSPSAQIAANIIAAAMSELEIDNAYLASEIVIDNLNELGPAGQDTLFGHGYPQTDVILSHDTTGIYDAALASPITTSDPLTGEPMITLVIDNPGTEPLRNATLHVTINGESYQTTIDELSPKESTEIPITVTAGVDQLSLSATVQTPDHTPDARPDDNTIRATITLAE